jgi:hypothetical protein
MTPDAIGAIVGETVRLQQLTNNLQAINLVLVFFANGLIVWSVVLIRKATKNNRKWTQSNAEWSARLAAQEREQSKA